MGVIHTKMPEILTQVYLYLSKDLNVIYKIAIQKNYNLYGLAFYVFFYIFSYLIHIFYKTNSCGRLCFFLVYRALLCWGVP